MSLKKYPTIVLLALLATFSPNPKYKPTLHEIKPKIILEQITQKQIHNQNKEGIEYTRQKHKKNTYHIIKIPNDKNTKINIPSTNEPKYLDELVAKIKKNNNENIIAAINGSFIRDNKIIGLVKTNGVEIHPNQIIRGSGYFTVKDGKANILRELCDTTKYDEVLQSFPLLIYNNELMKVENGKKSYRSAIAKDTKKNLYLIATDTHPLRKNTVTLSEFADFLKTQNYTKALNLDGGKSTQMYFNDYNIKNHRRINNAIAISR
jgi:exopolysaccharide biosynthesis protein